MTRAARILALPLALAPALASAQALPQATEAQVAAALGATPDHLDLFWAASLEGDVALAITQYPAAATAR